MVLRLLSCFLLLGGVGLLGVAAWGSRVWFDRPGATIDDPDREVRIDVGQTVAVTFRLHNPTRHPVQVVGLAAC